MSQFWKRSALLLFVGVFLTLTVAAPGAEVILTNGDRIEGQIVDTTADRITIRTIDSVLTIPRARISEIRESAPGSAELQLSEEFLRRGDFQKARDYLVQAETAGATYERIQEVQEKIVDAEAEQQLSRYQALIEQARQSAAQGIEDNSVQELRRILTTLRPGSEAANRIATILTDFHLVRAEDYRDKVLYREAIQELQQALELDPERPAAYMQLADLYKLSTSGWKQSIAYYSRAISLAETNDLPEEELTRAHWEKAELHRQSTDWKNAAYHYREVWRRDQKFHLRLKDRLMDAFRQYALELEDSNPRLGLMVCIEGLNVEQDIELMMLRARMLRSQGKFEESNAAFRDVLKVNPKTKMAHFYMGQNYFDMDESLSGREQLQQEIEIDPENYDALCQLADIALLRDDYAAAEKYYGQAHDVDPDKTRASLGLGKTYRLKGEVEKAREYVLEVLARLPEEREAILEMGRTYRDEAVKIIDNDRLQKQKQDEAQKYFTNVLQLIEKAPPEEREELNLGQIEADALLARGEIKLLRDGPATAQMDFQKALEAQPNYSTAYYNIGVAYRQKFASSKKLTDLQRAEENLKKARDLDPENPQYALELGIMYSQELAQIDPDNRQEYLKQAIENMETYIRLGGANAQQVRAWIAEIDG